MIYSYDYKAKDGDTYPGGVFNAKNDEEAQKILSTLKAPKGETVVLSATLDGKEINRILSERSHVLPVLEITE